MFHPTLPHPPTLLQFSMLGLGDIVIPGIFVAIILRYDAAHGSKYFVRCVRTRARVCVWCGVGWRGGHARREPRARLWACAVWGAARLHTCATPCSTHAHAHVPTRTHAPASVASSLRSAMGGYTLGLASTIVVMNVFQAAQPALLYIVPAVLGAVGAHAGEWQAGRQGERREGARGEGRCCTLCLRFWVRWVPMPVSGRRAGSVGGWEGGKESRRCCGLRLWCWVLVRWVLVQAPVRDRREGARVGDGTRSGRVCAGLPGESADLTTCLPRGH